MGTTFKIKVSTDDGHSYTNGGSFGTTWDGGVIGNYDASAFHTYLRFQDIEIPKGATITNAYVKFTAYNNQSADTVYLNVHFEDADNPTAPSSGADLISRPLTSGIVWDSLAAWTDGTTYNTPDLTNILQDVIDRSGWDYNNSITVHVIDDGSGSGVYRSPSMHDYSAAESAELYVEIAFNPNDWAYKLILTIDSSKIDGDLTDFPVLITLSSETGINNRDVTQVFDKLESNDNRKKIAITTMSGTEEIELYTEIERWDHNNEQAWLWTKVPTIVSGTDTILNLYYDSTHTTNSGYIGDTGETPAKEVWDDDFKAVLHMGQEPTGTLLDSTANENNGTPSAGFDAADFVDGQIGKAANIDSNHYITLPDIDVANITVEAVHKPAVPQSQNYPILAVKNPKNASWMTLIDREGVSHPLNSYVFYFDSSKYGLCESTTTYSNAWTYLGANYDLTNTKLFINEALEDTGNWSGAIPAGTTIGLAACNDPGNYFNVIYDEFRLSSVARSDAWMKATYYSNWDSLIIFGEITFTFINPLPVHQSTVYGASQTLQLTVTVSGFEENYAYDATFYDATTSGVIGSTISGTNSGEYVSTVMQTPSGIDYSWYLYATSSGEDDTSSTYIFTNKFKCAGTVKEGETALSGIPVRLYNRDTGELIGYTTSTGVSGTFEIITDYNEYYYAVALYASTVSGVDPTETNALIYDWLKP